MNLLLHIPHRLLLEEEGLVELTLAPITVSSEAYLSSPPLLLQSIPGPLTLAQSWESLGDPPESVAQTLLPEWSESLATSFL